MRTGITSWLSGWRRRDVADVENTAESFAPEVPFFAIGDIHGCAALLEKMLAQLDAAATGEETFIFLGDYVDRGPSARDVLTRLFELNLALPEKVVCLMGNHERMMLDFIDDPAGGGLHWLRYGGVETLQSFGVSAGRDALDSSACVDLANQLEAALPPGMQNWLRSLPLQWSSGNMHCVHAAMSPKRRPDAQKAEALLWGHPNFLDTTRDDNCFVVHGHTIVERGAMSGSRVSLDSGAYRTGRLTAARITGGACQFLEVSAPA